MHLRMWMPMTLTELEERLRKVELALESLNNYDDTKLKVRVRNLEIENARRLPTSENAAD